MRRVVRLAAVLILTALSFLVAPQSACACSCVGGTEQEFADRADVVFVGIATDVERPSTNGNVRVEFFVERVLKGEAAERLTVSTSASGASCGFDFWEGQRFQVYAREGSTGLCSGNKLLSGSQSPLPPLSTTEPGVAPRAAGQPVDEPFPTGWVLLAGAVVVAGAAAFVLHRRRAR